VIAWCRLTRQRDGEVLILDGAGDVRVIDDVAVTEVPIEDGADVADGVVERARMVLLDVIVSDDPIVEGIETRGQERLEEVLDFLRRSVGELLTLTTTDRPTYRDLLLMSRGSPTHSAEDFASRLVLPMRQSTILRARETQIATQDTLASSASAGGAREDRGKVGKKKKTLAKAAKDGIVAAVGL
jgi:hypothetical protein